MAHQQHRAVLGTLLLCAACALAFPLPADVRTNHRAMELSSSAGAHSGVAWTVCASNSTSPYQRQLCVNATVPGDVYSALHSAGVIADPLVAYNDVAYRWIAATNWTYRTSFTPPADVCLGGWLWLVADGLQTVADVRLNSNALGSSSSAFVSARFDAHNAMCNGYGQAEHSLSIAFTSSVHAAAAAAASYAEGPLPDAPAYLDGLPFRNFLRTDQSSFGWDWGPGFAPVAITAAPRLLYGGLTSLSPCADAIVAFAVPTVVPVPVPTTRRLRDTDNAFTVTVRVGVEFPVPTGGDCELRLRAVAAGVGLNASAVRRAGTAAGAVELVATATARNAPLWWPVGLGAQPLVPLACSVTTTSPAATGTAQETIVAAWTEHVGFRSVELITYGDPLADARNRTGNTASPQATPTKPEPSMYFRINGVPVFAKGSNVIPPHVFPQQVTPALLDGLVRAALDSHSNMVRVWGGGAYLPRAFYAACDAAGLMVWQEMMFACAAYPVDAAFLAAARREVQQQVRRLARHASIVLWSGNNEDGSVYDTGLDSPYVRLNTGTVLDAIVREDVSRPIWPSSPSSGFVTGVDASGLPAGTVHDPAPIVARGPGAPPTATPSGGDTHYYNYAACPAEAAYPRTNFASEYGFEAFPLQHDLSPYAPPQAAEPYALFGPFLEHRQRHVDGNTEMARLILSNFAVRPEDEGDNAAVAVADVAALNTSAAYGRVAFLSQVLQALCVGGQAAFYRRGRDAPQRTMGSLYWQLNQAWAAPSWASVEYSGAWRLLHYRIAAAYAPVAVSLELVRDDTSLRAGAVRVHAANDMLRAAGVAVTLWLVPYAGPHAAVAVANVSVRVPPLRGVNASLVDMDAALLAHRTVCPTAAACFVLVRPAPGADVAVPEALCTIAPLHTARLAPAVVSVAVSHVALGTARVAVAASNTTALYVTVHSPCVPGRFSDNGFVLLRGESRTLEFVAAQGFPVAPSSNNNTDGCTASCMTSAAAFQRTLRVETLNDHVLLA